MVALKSYLPFIKCQLWLNSIIFSNNMTWDSKVKRFYPVKLNTRVTMPALTMVSYISIVSHRMFQLISGNESDNGGFIKNIPALVLFISAAAGCGMGLISFAKRNDITVFFNAIVKFEEIEYGERFHDEEHRMNVGGDNRPEMLQKLFTNISKFLQVMKNLIGGGNAAGKVVGAAGCYTTIAMPIFTIAFLVRAPCSIPMFLRSSLSDCPPRAGLPVFDDTLIHKVVFITLDVMFIGYGVSLGCMSVCTVFLSGVVCFRGYVKRLKQEYKKEGRPLKIVKNIETLICIKILESHYNGMNAAGLVPLMMTDMASLAILTTYSCIALHSDLSFPMLLFSIVMASDALIIVQFLSYNSAGDVNQFSKDLLILWTHDERVQRSRYLKKKVKSLSVIKIRMGTAGNYLQKVTPLIFNDFSIGQAISLALVTKKK